MDILESAPKKNNLARIVCAFAAFFTFAVPALAIAVGISSHSTLVELATQAVQGNVQDSFSLTFLDWHRVLAWTLFAVSLVLSGWTFCLCRRNNSTDSLTGSGRIVFSLGLMGMLSALYLGALTVAADRLLLPFLFR